MMADIVEGPTIAALSCGKPAYLVVLLHGAGGAGQAIVEQALNWAPTMPKADFLAAEAPFACDGEGAGRQWFDPAIVRRGGIVEGVTNAMPALDRFLDEMLAKRRLPDSHLALVGFSDGATLALHVALRRRAQIAAIVGFSTQIGDVTNLAGDIRTKPPTLLIHGDGDPIAPFAALTDMKTALKTLGVPVKSLRRPGLGHAMDDDGVIVAGDFLTEHVVHKQAAKHDHDH
jgi:phospholipase/carboxylesterase